MPSTSPLPPASRAPRANFSKKSRRWRRRILWTLLGLIVVLAPLANGPIFRRIVDWQLGKALHDLGLEGEFEVKGSLLGGLELHGMRLAGPLAIESLTLADARIDYRLLPLLGGKWGEGVTRIHVSELAIRIDQSKDFAIDPRSAAERAEEEAKQTPGGQSAQLWPNLNALLEQDLSIDGLDLTIVDAGQPFLELRHFALALSGGNGSLSCDRITLPNGEQTTMMQAELESSGGQILQISSLALADDLAIDRLTLAPPPSPDRLPQLSGQLRVLGGTIVAEQTGADSWQARLASGAVDLAKLDAWLQQDLGISGKISALAAHFDPGTDHPILLEISTEQLAYEQYVTDTATARLACTEGFDHIRLDALALAVGENSLQFGGSYDLEPELAALSGTIDAPELGALCAKLGLPPISGSLAGKFEFRYEDGDFSKSSGSFTGSDLAYADNVLRSASFDLSAANNETLDFNLLAKADDQPGNAVRSEGSFTPSTGNIDASLRFDFSDLGKLAAASAQVPPLGGSLSGEAQVRLADGKLTDSSVKLTSKSLTYQDASIAELDLRAETTAPDAIEFSAAAAIDAAGANKLSASGNYRLDQESYQAKADLEIADLAGLHPLLATLGIDQLPTGKLDLAWHGSGELLEDQHRGQASVPEFAAKFEGADAIGGKFELAYAPGDYHLTELVATSTDFVLSGAAHLAGQRLDVVGMRLSKRDLPIARAELSLPLDTTTVTSLDSFLDQPGPVSVKIDSDQLKLADLMAITGTPASIAATIDAKIEIGGTLSEPTGTGKLDARQLHSPLAAEIAPADVALNFQLRGGQIVLDGTLAHPEITTVTISGHTPLRLRKIAGISDQSIDLAIHLPDTPLGIAKKYVPDLQSVTGTASADLRLSGSITEPVLAGDFRLNSPLLKFKGQNIPTISEFVADLHLDDRQLQVKSFGGYVAGGKMAVAGSVDLADLTNPQFALELTAEQALLVRDDSLSLRANARLALDGPLEKAALVGKVGITQSRFFREIEILPIGLPKGSPTPAAPRAPSFAAKSTPGLDVAPFSNWDVDVQILTDDPFLVRSNLAAADISSDLRITGTLGAPLPSGKIRLDKGIATLPFSELKTTEGSLDFSAETAFDPEIHFRAVSRVQDYEIRIIAYGRLSDPKTIISSDPPLPETEAVSLLATGSKTSDLKDGELIAGDAALLLIDKLRRKYGKGTPLERRPGGLRDLLSFKAGQIDPRTGQRAASASMEISDNIYLLGNVDVGGDYRGLVKFIFRFD